MDLRERVIASVKREGQSRRQAADRFGIAISTAIHRIKRFGETGSAAPGQMGGHKPKTLSGAHADWLRQRCLDHPFTLRGLVRELADERGLNTATTWYVVMTNPGCDERAEAAIEAAGFTAYRPSWRKDVRHNRTKVWTTRTFRLFPRHVFVRLPSQDTPFGRVRGCDGVACILGAQGQPTPIPSRLVEMIELAEFVGPYDERRPVPKPVIDAPAVALGQRVRVDAGHRRLGGEAGQAVGIHGRREVTLMLDRLAGLRPVRHPSIGPGPRPCRTSSCASPGASPFRFGVTGSALEGASRAGCDSTER